jgi:hypothetical protein
VPATDGVPLIVNEELEATPVTPLGKPPPVLEIVAELVAVYTIAVIAVFWCMLWLAVPLEREMVGTGFTTAVTVAALPDWQVVPLEVSRAYADTDLAPVAALLTVKVPLPVPETVPAVPNHV